MKVSAWNDGQDGYGFSVRHDDRQKYFSKNWKTVKIELPNGMIAHPNVTSTFWTTCSELRSSDIKKWLFDIGKASWEKGCPPKFDMIPIGKPKETNKFKIVK